MENVSPCRPAVIGVAGPSGSGKSSLAIALAQRLGARYVPEDPAHFILPYVSYSERDARYEAPGNVKWEAAEAALSEALASAGARGAARPVVVVEHYFLLAKVSSLLPFLDFCLVLDPCIRLTDAEGREVCRERRVGRGHRTPAEADALRRYYDEVVWPHYKQHTVARIDRTQLSSSAILRLDAAGLSQQELSEAAEQACVSWIAGAQASSAKGPENDN
eukprot:TRINITY_DN45408_c0_g1_i1.p1 TRINITY_DN45408_c0_g1~~TRINITY_DN45408_c0_g1_i1.p1  ORF type:complete len:219 (-),score=22.64 TRINITY_DN45408_c0_g1_i1:23-679(-)